jgi:hypothetical protein
MKFYRRFVKISRVGQIFPFWTFFKKLGGGVKAKDFFRWGGGVKAKHSLNLPPGIMYDLKGETIVQTGGKIKS